MTSSLKILAPAKINWALKVLGKRRDGFHEIDTLMQTISLADELRVRSIRPRECRIVCADPGVPTDKSNLIAKAWFAMRETFGYRVGGIEVQLKKKIPTGAGLGGGSSDAAATLLAIRKLFRLPISEDNLVPLAAQLGSDVPFFIYGGTARAQGRGEILTPVDSAFPPIHLVIVYPGFPHPTAAAYAKLKSPAYRDGSKSKAARGVISRMVSHVQQGRVGSFMSDLHNSFHDAYVKLGLPHYLIFNSMEEKRLNPILLSGSGSAMFGVANSALHARRAAKLLSVFGLRGFAVKTIHAREAH